MHKSGFVPVESVCSVCEAVYTKTHFNSRRCPTCNEQNKKRCKVHNDVILGRNKSCMKCAIENSLIKYTEENKDDWIECPLCCYRGGDLGQHIIKHHKMTTDEFRQTTGMTVIKSKNLRERIAGDKNPAYQHGGKFSPFSENFIYADTTNINEIKEKAAQARKDNESDVTTLVYWLKKTDGDIEEAKRLLSERQSTFSLEKCIEKYGEDDGTKRWIERQEKWQDTLNNKTKEEIDEINRKKSNQMSFNILWKNENDANGIFYILQLNNNIIKIGITTKSVKHRYRKLPYTVIKNLESPINDCFKLEQLIKNKFKEYVIQKENAIDGFGYTESFDVAVLDDIISFSEQYLYNKKELTELFTQTFNLKYEENFKI